MVTNKTYEIAKMIDVSCVRTDVTLAEIEKMISVAKQYKFIAAFAMPCYTKFLREQLEKGGDVLVGGVVGFPSGADTTEMKQNQVREMLDIGVDEIDMVVNVGQLISGNAAYVRNEISEIVRMAAPKPVKCIVEVCYLTDQQLRKVSEVVAEGGAAYIKTGTGWGPKPTTVETIKTIKEVVGDQIKIKAAGGIRTLDTMLAMVDAGCSRFGIGVNSAVRIMEEVAAR